MLACLQEIELYPYSIFYKFESNVRTRKLWNATVNHPTQVLETPVSALFPFMLSRNFETRSTTNFAPSVESYQRSMTQVHTCKNVL